MEKLKRCPFYGGKAIFATKSIGHVGGCAGFDFAIKCESCHAKAPNAYGTIDFYFDQNGEIVIYNNRDERSRAIEAWNRRVEDDQT